MSEKLFNVPAAKLPFILEKKKSEPQKDDSNMINQLKIKLSNTTKYNEKLFLLSSVPANWTQEKIRREFVVTRHTAAKVKKLIINKGSYSWPEPRHIHALSQDTKNLVIDFYNNDDISRIMPGRKDYKSVKTSEGSKVHKQKRLILFNLKEAYTKFKELYPSVKIGFSKFAELKPEECVLAGAKGTHSVCVCTIHQNSKLMFKAIENVVSYDNVINCMKELLCEEPSSKCYLSRCDKCPSSDVLKQEIVDCIQEASIKTLSFKCWRFVDRCIMEQITMPSLQFLDEFITLMTSLKAHHFIAKNQSSHLNNLKNSLAEDTIIVILDFSENYSVVIQDEVQGYHWCNQQATVHPFVCYYKESNELKTHSFVIISENLQHNTFNKKYRL